MTVQQQVESAAQRARAISVHGKDGTAQAKARTRADGHSLRTPFVRADASLGSTHMGPGTWHSTVHTAESTRLLTE